MFSPLFFPLHIFRVLIGVIIQRINKVLRHVVHLCCIQYRNSIIINSIMSIAVLNTSYHVFKCQTWIYASTYESIAYGFHFFASSSYGF